MTDSVDNHAMGQFDRRKGNNRKTGTQGENMAVKYLMDQGYQIITRNYRCFLGEIDIIARQNGYLVFIEVKYRKNSFCGSPFAAITTHKQQTIRKVAQYYIMEHQIRDCVRCRFDAVGITDRNIMVIKDAF